MNKSGWLRLAAFFVEMLYTSTLLPTPYVDGFSQSYQGLPAFFYTLYTFFEVARVNTAQGVGQHTWLWTVFDLDSQIDILQAQQEHTLSEAI